MKPYVTDTFICICKDMNKFKRHDRVNAKKYCNDMANKLAELICVFYFVQI